MSLISFPRRAVAIAGSAALLISGSVVGTASAQSSNLSANLSSSGSSFIGIPSGFCETSGSESCEADNGVVKTAMNPTIVGDQMTTEIEISGLRSVDEEIALSYSASGVDVSNLVAVSGDAEVTIEQEGDVYSIVIPDGLAADETVTIRGFGTIEDPEGASQSLTVVTGTPADDFVGLLGSAAFSAIGVFAVVEHLHNIQWLPREVDQWWLQLTGRDPALTQIQ